MPISVLMTVGAVVLAGSASAGAAEAAVPLSTTSTTKASSLDEAAVDGQVPATVKVSDTETVKWTRKGSARASKRLTSKVKSTVKVTAKATRTGKATRTVQVTRYAPTYAQAVTEARGIAKKAAHDRAKALAKARAGKLALAKARSVAKQRAKARVKVAVRTKFGNMVIKRAAAQKGKPYSWGSAGPRAFDCSGLVTYVMKGVGVKKLPRTSSALAKKAAPVSKSHKKRGDLVFFTSNGRVYHVAMYAGHGKIWHSPGSGRKVTKAKIWTSSYKVGRLPA